jgi:hypothetical protein
MRARPTILIVTDDVETRGSLAEHVLGGTSRTTRSPPCLASRHRRCWHPVSWCHWPLSSLPTASAAAYRASS